MKNIYKKTQLLCKMLSMDGGNDSSIDRDCGFKKYKNASILQKNIVLVVLQLSVNVQIIIWFSYCS